MNFTFLIKILIISLLILLVAVFTISPSNIKGESFAYITNQGENTISVVNLNDLIVQKTIDVGDSPLGIAIIDSKELAIIGNVDSQNLSIIDLKKMRL